MMLSSFDAEELELTKGVQVAALQPNRAIMRLKAIGPSA
jgi:hypothetical protein